jgi:hypothetical protein
MEAKFENLKTVRERVLFLINQNPDLAYDSDKLIHTYLYNEIGAEKVNDISGYDLFLCLVSKYQPLTKIETISRARRIVIAKLKKQGLFVEKSKEPQKTLFKIKNSD